MPRRPFLIFDKSSLQSLNIDEAALLDTFYSCVITPIFFVECLADLEKKGIRSKSTPEQIVGSLADRTPRYESCLTIHHLDILRWELTAETGLMRFKGGPFVPGPKSVELGDQKGIIFQQTKEEEAMDRWMAREFLAVERLIAKQWRQSLAAIDFQAVVKAVMAEIGPHWRKPKTLQDAKQMADIIIDQMDQQWLLGFGIDILGLAEIKEQAVLKWVGNRRPPLQECAPHFIFMLTINVFFCLVLSTQLLRNVKPSHQIDLAYLYYLPFCSIFTSKDNFHAQIAPLFLTPEQTFVNGSDLKEDLKKLDERYSALDESEFKAGTTSFARHPPDDRTFLTTRLWDKHVPKWRDAPPPVKLNKQLQDAIMEMMQKVSASQEVAPHNLASASELAYVSKEHKIPLVKGKYHRYSEELEERIIADETTP
jgi:hypothetical protein